MQQYLINNTKSMSSKEKLETTSHQNCDCCRKNSLKLNKGTTGETQLTSCWSKNGREHPGPSHQTQNISFSNYSGMKTTCFIKHWEKNKSKGDNQIFSPLGSSLSWRWSSARQQEQREYCSSAEKPKLSRRLRCIERVVEHDISAGAPRWDGCQLLWPASFTSPAAVKDGFSRLERSQELLSEQTTRFISDHPLLRRLDLLCARQILGGSKRIEATSVFQWGWTSSSWLSTNNLFLKPYTLPAIGC